MKISYFNSSHRGCCECSKVQYTKKELYLIQFKEVYPKLLPSFALCKDCAFKIGLEIEKFIESNILKEE